MDIHRPTTFSEIIGHKTFISHWLGLINAGQFPQFTLVVGDEGIGKSTIIRNLAKALDCKKPDAPCECCATCMEINKKVIQDNVSTQDVKIYKLTKSSTKDDVELLKNDLNAEFIKGRAKVIIMEDVHCLNEMVQEELLSILEYLPKNVYILATANTTSTLLNRFVSRATVWYLQKLKHSELIQLLKMEANRRGLTFPSIVPLELIATWADNKARRALKALEAMGENRAVDINLVKAYISYIDVSEVTPIIESFLGNPLVGMKACLNLTINEETQRYLSDYLISAIKLANGDRQVELDEMDKIKLEEILKKLDVRVLCDFLLEISRIYKLTNRKLLAAYLSVHPYRSKIHTPDKEVLNKELNDKAKLRPVDLDATNNSALRDQQKMINPITIDALMKNGSNWKED